MRGGNHGFPGVNTSIPDAFVHHRRQQMRNDGSNMIFVFSDSGRTVSTSSSGDPILVLALRRQLDLGLQQQLPTLELRANGQKTAIQDAHERALDAQITADETKDAVQELRTAVPDPIAAQEALTAAQLAQSHFIANLKCIASNANAEGDHECGEQIKQKTLEVV
ncbi:hypothetical protein E4U47_000785 [Claviceps purpurea]|nr:hypothetical protein E4U47_000785 [Claviceps purpurea]